MIKNAMVECVLDQKRVIEEIVSNEDEYINELVEHFDNHDVKRVYILGHGSPYNAGFILSMMMEKYLNVEVSVTYASLFNNHMRFNSNEIYKRDEMLLICPAQSGKTSGPVNAAKTARELGIPVVCTTLLKDGILARNSDIVILKNSGKEESFAETKGVISTLVIMMLATLKISYNKNIISLEEYQNLRNDVANLSTNLLDIVDTTMKWYEENKNVLLKSNYLTFIGAGENYPTAVEGSLKILETTLIPCLSYECEEYMHGQNQPVGSDSVIFMIANKGSEFNRVTRLAEWCREKGAHVIVLQNKNNTNAHADDLLLNTFDKQYFSSVEYLIPFQLLGALMADDMGLSCVVANHDDAGKELGVRYED